MHAIMKHWHPMIGRDLHIPWPPGSPSPAPSPVPYVTSFLMLGLSIPGVTKYASSHQSQGFGMTMQKGTDIGPMIPHIGAPSVLMAVEIPLSSSKSYFGPAALQAEGEPIAAALLFNTNLNLNCGTPVPVPFGNVIVLNTHYVSMSMADILGGLGAMVSDWAIQSALQVFGGRAIGRLGARAAASRLGSYITSKVSARVQQRALFRALMSGEKWANTAAFDAALAWERAAPQVIEETLGNVAGFFIGGPMGLDAGTFGGPTAAGGASDTAQDSSRSAGEDAGEAIENYLEDDSIDDMGDYPEPAGDNNLA